MHSNTLRILVLIIGILSFGYHQGSAEAARVASVVTCQNVDDSATKPVGPTDKFKPDQAAVHALVSVVDPAPGTKVKGVWVSVDAISTPNYEIDSAVVEFKREGNATVHFTLSRPTNGWPVGNYKIDVYVNDQLAGSAPFSIK